MNVGYARRVAPWVLVLLAGGVACSTSCAKKKASIRSPEHAIVLIAEPHGTGHWKANAHPDILVVNGYDPETPDTVVYWGYGHKSTKIRFNEYPLIPDPDCPDGKHLCTVHLPKGLVPGHQYKYTVKGQYDDKTDLDENDPWIEVDR